MAYQFDRVEREDGGGSFLMGLLAGTVLGAGLGMLFAPKAGCRGAEAAVGAGEPPSLDRERHDPAGVGESGSGVAAGIEKIGQASDKVSQMVDRGRDVVIRRVPTTGKTPTV